MTQNQGESVTNYVARLKAKAFLCQFDIPCPTCDPPTRNSYAEEMVAQRLVAGLSNPDHQRKVLSEAATLRTLADKINRLQILETTEESATVLHQTQPASVAAAQSSSYKRETKPRGTPPLKMSMAIQSGVGGAASSHIRVGNQSPIAPVVPQNRSHASSATRRGISVQYARNH